MHTPRAHVSARADCGTRRPESFLADADAEIAAVGLPGQAARPSLPPPPPLPLPLPHPPSPSLSPSLSPHSSLLVFLAGRAHLEASLPSSLPAHLPGRAGCRAMWWTACRAAGMVADDASRGAARRRAAAAQPPRTTRPPGTARRPWTAPSPSRVRPATWSGSSSSCRRRPAGRSTPRAPAGRAGPGRARGGGKGRGDGGCAYGPAYTAR